jgi:tryptophan-rich sensory protein
MSTFSDSNPRPPLSSSAHDPADAASAAGDGGPGGVQTQPAAVAIVACAAAVVLTTLLEPTDPDFWSRELVRPDPFLPPVMGAFLEVLRMAGTLVFGVVLYRAQVHLHPPLRWVGFGLVAAIMLLHALWNPVVYHAGSLGAWVVVGGLLVLAFAAALGVLFSRDRLAGWLLLPYALLELHEFWWALSLARLNPGA